MLPLKVDQDYDLEQILKQLIGQQYKRNDLVVTRGTFRLRGDTLDIFPVYEDIIWRLEFFGDTLERISSIDEVTGEVIGNVEELAIFPATHYATSRELIDEVIEDINKDLNESIRKFKKEEKLLEAQRIEQRTVFDMEMLKEIGFCSGIENYSRYFDGREAGQPPFTLLDYFPEDFLMVIDESHQAIPQIRGQYEGDKSRKTTLVDYGFRLPAALDNRPLMFNEWESKVSNTILVSATPGKWEKENSSVFVEQIIRPTGLVDPEVEIRDTRNQVEDLKNEIDQVINNGYRVLVTTLTKKMSEALSDYLLESGYKTRYLHSDIDTLERIEILRDLRRGEFDILVGINLLRQGLDLPEVGLVAIFDADKEGFLRSETSLIQTIGRAARNKDGYVIMYADRVTDSMSKAINETNKRREKQKIYNKKNGITPKTIDKEITDILQLVEKVKPIDPKKRIVTLDIKNASKKDLNNLKVKLEDEMNAAADLLEFEIAARLRDELKELSREIKEINSHA